MGWLVRVGLSLVIHRLAEFDYIKMLKNIKYMIF